LIHFVADLHQPLHAADNSDAGGTRFFVVLRDDLRICTLCGTTTCRTLLVTMPRRLHVVSGRAFPPNNGRIGVGAPLCNGLTKALDSRAGKFTEHPLRIESCPTIIRSK
jgi:hypothetical protein